MNVPDFRIFGAYLAVEEEKALQKFVEAIKKKYSGRIEKIFLFGSYARGDYGRVVYEREDFKADSNDYLRYYVDTPFD
ncbi:MAG: nucleotidyltransferase domain-containing protein [Candidatus Jordarchaeum sp.]|uniref:nucleotidyltransferase domain-containing protein n=1 Tax=Candidatus Jordarchaeum sp. TaxID=2823881 RepID=UPI00404B12CD